MSTIIQNVNGYDALIRDLLGIMYKLSVHVAHKRAYYAGFGSKIDRSTTNHTMLFLPFKQIFNSSLKALSILFHACTMYRFVTVCEQHRTTHLIIVYQQSWIHNAICSKIQFHSLIYHGGLYCRHV